MSNQDLPETLKYSDSYLWVKIENDNALLGVTKPAARAVKLFVFAEFCINKDEVVKKGDDLIILEAEKWSGRLTSPLTGKVLSINEAVVDNPELINKDPYNTWLVKLALEKKQELQELMDSKQAMDWYKRKGLI
ncbi:glycine cleavage system protein H [Candidatus Woesearchaeota archaeon]|nr:glycine cleavage system protein H [Candidatus Woesearchaeota archaeon]